MRMKNKAVIDHGFESLLVGFAPYVARELQITYGPNWWRDAVLDRLYDDRKQNLPYGGDWGTLVDSMDIALALNLFNLHWNEVFRKKLSKDHRAWANELIHTRNKSAHITTIDFEDRDVVRALDTMSRLTEQIDPDGAEEILDLLREFQYGSDSYSNTPTETKKKFNPKEAGILNVNLEGLPSWRDVIEPHPDVAHGRYKNAEFAADLAQVARGEGAIEYKNAKEFFNRTYVTEGMAGLLVQGLKRVSGKDGEPVIQLKTAFGGGKTHSMLALYHLLRGSVSMDELSGLDRVFEEAGVRSLPRTNVAVLVGTAIDPTKSRRPTDMPGITINTIWGDIAYQLAKNAGRPELYDYVKESDKKGVSPGSETLKNLLDDAGPVMILMDELVAYAKKLSGRNDLPAGTFDNFITFIQEITEAARASKNSLVVASIPESDIETGGDAGKEALEAIEHTFGRMESIWKPVAADEGFEVVRRRLFLDCKNPALRDKVCNTFSQMYLENEGDFPIESREVEYRDRMISCYPIHPEVFDRLYNDWATLERFQRTRGVLRLMAAVIHELWMGNDAGAMIMPGSIQLSVPNVRDELTRHLPENWNAIVDKEVDGKASIPYQIDQEGRFGKQIAGRRVARTIMLGSAPTERSQTVRGIEQSRIRLGVAQPGENISVFNDALNKLKNRLQYLYSNPSGDRFWYDTRPTLRKTAEDRATQLKASYVEYEIETRLKNIRKEKPFAGVHIAPASSLDVPDEQTARLVILKPGDTYKQKNHDNKAIASAEDILNNRGGSPRIYRNMLAFVAPDDDAEFALTRAVREYLAWKSIKEDSEDLNLDAAQNRETANNLKRSNETVDLRIKETYSWLLAPSIDREEDLQKIEWTVDPIKGGSDTIVKKAANKMLSNESLITRWAPSLLTMEMDDVLWTDREDISIKELWDYLTKYCYLPRLTDYSVLEEAIRNGLDSKEYFGIADGKNQDRYINLKYGQPASFIDKSSLLVKPFTASKQILEEKEQKEREEEERRRRREQERQNNNGSTGGSSSNSSSSSNNGSSGGSSGTDTPPDIDDEPVIPTPPPVKNTSFYMTTKLDNIRVNRDVQRLVDEIINHLQNIDGAKVEISLEVSVKAPNGIPSNTVRTVSENCQVLKVDDFGFDD